MLFLAFSLGLMSSFHCVGMCGPIALALPIHKGSKSRQLGGLLTYNLGRASTYALLGALIGALGGAVAWVGYLRYLSVAAGVLMILYAVWPSRLDHAFRVPGFWQKSVGKVKAGMARLLQSRSVAGWVALGMLNGLLPCGMVYLAVVSAVAMGSAANGAAYMFFFGLGTIPAMMAVGFFKHWFSPVVRTKMRRLTPILMAVAGVWLVARGLMIQVPVNFFGAPAEIPVCHGGSLR